MKKQFVLTGLLAGLLSISTLGLAADTKATSAAVSAGNLKIAVLDVNQVLQQSPQLKTMADKAKAEFKPREEKILAMQKKIADAEAKLKRDLSTLSASDAAKLQEKVASDQRELRRQEEDFMQDAGNAQKAMMSKVADQLNKIVQKIADEGHYDVILQKNNVAFASSRVDVTQQVVDAMKK